MKQLTWRDKAIHSIANALLEYEAQCLLMGEPIEGKAAKKWISKERFPFGLDNTRPTGYGSKKLPRFPISSARDGRQHPIRDGVTGYQSATEDAKP
jgi:hypothetical protein